MHAIALGGKISKTFKPSHLSVHEADHGHGKPAVSLRHLDTGCQAQRRALCGLGASGMTSSLSENLFVDCFGLHVDTGKEGQPHGRVGVMVCRSKSMTQACPCRAHASELP